MSDIPHVWHVRDEGGSECRHLAMCREGAIQGYLLHHGLLSYDKKVVATDEGSMRYCTPRDPICFDPSCVLLALSVPPSGEPE